MDRILDATEQKRLAAMRGADYVTSGMIVGLGSGSTANCLIDILGERVRSGLRMVGVPTSDMTRIRAEKAGIPLVNPDDVARLDITIDGADEIGPDLTLIKGGGGAHLREKIIASASNMVVVIAESRKRVPVLGNFPLPLEIVPFGTQAILSCLEGQLRRMGFEGECVRRRDKDGHPMLSDNRNDIFDLHLQGRITDPGALNTMLDGITGVVEHGLFVGMADVVVLVDSGGRVDIVTRGADR